MYILKPIGLNLISNSPEIHSLFVPTLHAHFRGYGSVTDSFQHFPFIMMLPTDSVYIEIYIFYKLWQKRKHSNFKTSGLS